MPAAEPYCARSTMRWSCSTRTPIENGFCRDARREGAASRRCRARCGRSPGSAPRQRTPRARDRLRHDAAEPPSASRMRSDRRVPKRTSPPSDSISSRSPRTTAVRWSVPMWGLPARGSLRRRPPRRRLQHAAASGVVRVGGELAVREGARAALAELDVRVRVETPSRMKAFTARTRSVHGCARSSTSGRAPARARMSAAKSPAGPVPTTTGRTVGGATRDAPAGSGSRRR